MQSADNVLFGENKKAHPLGIGGLSIDMAHDNVLLQLNADAYDSATEFQLYTEGVLRAINKFTATHNAVEVISLYKESKVKSIIDRIKAWFKNAYRFLKERTKKLWARITGFFKKKGNKAKTTPPGEPSAPAKQAMITMTDSVKNRESVAKVIADGIEEGLKSVAREVFSKNNLKYGNNEIKALAMSIIEAAYRHAGADETSEFAKDIRNLEFWETCKGTEYESTAVMALVTMYICGTGIHPYIPSKVMDYLDTKEANGKKIKSAEIFTGVWNDHESAAGLMFDMAGNVIQHISDMYDVISNTPWGEHLKDSKIAVLSNGDVLATEADKLMKHMSMMGDKLEGEYPTDDDKAKAVAKTLVEFKSLVKPFDGMVSNPKSALHEISLDALVKNVEVHMVPVRQLDQLLSLHEEIADIDKIMAEISGENSGMSTDVLSELYKAAIEGLTPIIKVGNSLGIVFSLMFKSFSDIEEEMVGFYGSHVTADSVPVTAIAKTIALNPEMRNRFIKAIGL